MTKDTKETKDNENAEETGNIINIDFSSLTGKNESEQEIEVEAEAEEEDSTIFEIREFSDGMGRKVTAIAPVTDIENAPDWAEAQFRGSFMINTHMGPMEVGMEFEPTFTLNECFEKFDENAERTVKEKQKEAEERQRIVTLDQLQNGVDPNSGQIFTP
jgi:hypothetical protein